MYEQPRKGFFRRFFGGIWGLITWLRVAILNLLFLVIVGLILTSIFSNERVPFPESTTLTLVPSGYLVDQYSYVDPVTQLMTQDSPADAETLVHDLVDAIYFAAADERINALVLDLNYLLGGGISKLDEIGAALQQFKAQNKPVIAFSSHYSQTQYYLASYADEVYMHSMGGVLLTGFGSYRNYMKSALDKLQIDMHVFRTGDYKDAVEPYIQNEMSPASKEHTMRWLTDLWSHYTQQVELARELEPGSIDHYINNMGERLEQAQGDTALLAYNAGLVDKLMSHIELGQMLQQRFGSHEKHDYNTVSMPVLLAEHQQPNPFSYNNVAVLVASGVIMDGEQPEGTVGSSTFTELARKAREDDTVKAVVVRVDSPGGSAFASEIIRQELQSIRQAGKPVVISMGSVAASGGYWISTSSDKVFATPTTITGSIGVFTAFPTLENSLQELGIYTDGVGTTRLAGAARLDRDLSPQVQSIVQQGVEGTYQRFLTLVAEARDLPVEEVNQIAQGRVWSGESAMGLQLVDAIGDLNAAIDAAAELASLEQYEIKWIERDLTPAELFFKQLAEQQASLPEPLLDSLVSPALQTHIRTLIEPLSLFAQMNDPQNVYAHCDTCGEF